jgi:hypothetical protein
MECRFGMQASDIDCELLMVERETPWITGGIYNIYVTPTAMASLATAHTKEIASGSLRGAFGEGGDAQMPPVSGTPASARVASLHFAAVRGLL